MEILKVCNCNTPIWVAINDFVICYHKNVPILIQDLDNYIFISEDFKNIYSDYKDVFIVKDIVDILERVYNFDCVTGDLNSMLTSYGFLDSFGDEIRIVDTKEWI